MDGAKVIIEVAAGIIPGEPMANHTQRWVITASEWGHTSNQARLLAETNGQAMGYAGYLMLQPSHVNWVRTDWLWT